MCGPLRGAIIGAAVHEGIAADPEEAARLAERGGLRFGPCHERGAVGPMAGVVSASMPVWVVENGASGNRAFCTLNEGLGKVLRYGAYDTEVLDRLAWMRDVLARVLAAALERLDEPLDLRALIAQALQMGDEGHNRNRAGTSLLLRALLPALLTVEEPTADVVAAAEFISGNDHFFLNLAMAAGKATADAAAGTAGSSIVTAMARNGTEFGVRLAGTGDRWFTGPAGRGRRPLPARVRSRGRQPRHRRLDHHRDHRHRRDGHGRRPGHRPLRRRQPRRRGRGHPGHVRHHLGRERLLPAPDPRLPRHPARASTPARSSTPASSPPSTPASPTRTPASARSAPAWSNRPWRRSWPPPGLADTVEPTPPTA